MAKQNPALSDAMARTFTVAEKSALTRRASDLRFHLTNAHSDLHPIAQLLTAAFILHSYEIKHAALAMWDDADDKQRAMWVKDAEYGLQSIIWHEKHMPGFSEMLRRVAFTSDLDTRYIRMCFTTEPTPKPPVTHRPRPDYLRVVHAEAGGD